MSVDDRTNGRRRPGWIATFGVANLTLVLVAAAGHAATDVVPMPANQVIQSWADGPVRYLMSTKESDEIRGLGSIPQLVDFVTRFWARRDPTPGTFKNEWREVFWQRVSEANRRFGNSVLPGWKTDMGKIFILLGEPNEVRTDESPNMGIQDEDPALSVGQLTAEKATANRKADVAANGGRGIERWTYRRRYSTAAAAEFEVAFVLDQSLDWKLSSDPRLLEPLFPGASTLDPRDQAFGGINEAFDRAMGRQMAQDYAANACAIPPGAAGGAQMIAGCQANVAAVTQKLHSARRLEAPATVSWADSSLATWDLGLELAVPSNAELLLATVTAREFLFAFGFTAKFEFFRARDGSTFVNIGSLVSEKALYGDLRTGVSSLRVYAKMAPVADAAHPRYVSNEMSPLMFDLSKGAAPGGSWTCGLESQYHPGDIRSRSPSRIRRQQGWAKPPPR